MPQTQEAPAVTGTQDWRADYAYTVGVQAFIYGFPYIHNAKLQIIGGHRAGPMPGLGRRDQG